MELRAVGECDVEQAFGGIVPHTERLLEVVQAVGGNNPDDAALELHEVSAVIRGNGFAAGHIGDFLNMPCAEPDAYVAIVVGAGTEDEGQHDDKAYQIPMDM